MPQPQLPESLGNPPIVEALFELRFTADKKGAGDVLPGLLFHALRDLYEDVEPLPVARVPRELREADPNLKYLASHRLSGRAGVVQVGEHVFLVAAPTPYPGWQAFCENITQALDALRETGIGLTIERHSIKYMNLLEAEAGAQLAQLNVDLSLMGMPIPETGTSIRTEFQQNGQTLIVQIQTNTTTVHTDRPARSGLLLELDSIITSPRDFWASRDQQLNATHESVKSVFFRLLTAETLRRLDNPVG